MLRVFLRLPSASERNVFFEQLRSASAQSPSVGCTLEGPVYGLGRCGLYVYMCLEYGRQSPFDKLLQPIALGMSSSGRFGKFNSILITGG